MEHCPSKHVTSALAAEHGSQVFRPQPKSGSTNATHFCKQDFFPAGHETPSSSSSMFGMHVPRAINRGMPSHARRAATDCRDDFPMRVVRVVCQVKVSKVRSFYFRSEQAGRSFVKSFFAHMSITSAALFAHTTSNFESVKDWNGLLFFSRR